MIKVKNISPYIISTLNFSIGIIRLNGKGVRLLSFDGVLLTHMPAKAQAQRSMKSDFDSDTDWEWLPNRILITINQ
jgi:hypothetical protein